MGARWPSGLERWLALATGRGADGLESHCGPFGTLAIPFTPLCQCLSEETLKAVGHFLSGVYARGSKTTVVDSTTHSKFPDLQSAIMRRKTWALQTGATTTSNSHHPYYRMQIVSPMMKPKSKLACPILTRIFAGCKSCQWAGHVARIFQMTESQNICCLASSQPRQAQTPKYIGVRLDRMLNFKQHLEEVAGKVTSRVSLIRRLAGTNWGASVKTLRMSTQVLVFSAAL